MLTVACVLKSGGIYDATWVARLRAGVARHLPIEHRFVCLSDVDVPCERIPLENNWPGWWSKVELFHMNWPSLVFDLDTAIVGDLTDIARAAQSKPFIMLRDFYRPDGVGSGVMSWNGVDISVASFYDAFCKAPAKWMKDCPGGDQQYVERVAHMPGIVRWQDVVGDQIVSYKVHCRDGIPADARVVCLHGRPKFADMPLCDPVRQAWELAA